jgi:alkylation response protein AidB-like acyl-CoA dehydrogenase
VLSNLARLVPVLERVPFPGAGKTWMRWKCLIAIAASDASLGRLAEGHLDALAILDELGRPELVNARQTWGVWAAQPEALSATPTAVGWHLVGAKSWCSGSSGLDRALVTAIAPDGPRLFVVSPHDDRILLPRHGSWTPFGMQSTLSETIDFDVHLPSSAAIGSPSAYVDRPGFHHGGAGVAACWFGATTGVVTEMAAGISSDPHCLARWGRTRARLEAAGARLQVAAAEIDGMPYDVEAGERVARSVRLAVEDACRSALEDVIVTLGASGLTRPHQHQRIADAMMYLRQLRPDGDAAQYGAMGGVPLKW